MNGSEKIMDDKRQDKEKENRIWFYTSVYREKENTFLISFVCVFTHVEDVCGSLDYARIQCFLILVWVIWSESLD